MTNYRFKKEFENNAIKMTRKMIKVTKDNLTDELAEEILNMPAFRHNIELIPGKEQEVLIKKKAEGGELELPESIVSALKEAETEEQGLSKQQPEKESSSSSSMPTKEKAGKKKK